MVAGRGARGPEEQDRAPLGPTRHPAPRPARSADEFGLHLRGDLPPGGQGRGLGPAPMRHAGHEPAPGGSRAGRGSRSPWGHADGPGRMAPRQGPRRARQPHAGAAAGPSARIEPGREHLAVSARELVVEPRVRLLPRHRRSLLRRLEPPHRPALDHHVHRPPRLGQCMIISAGWYELVLRLQRPEKTSRTSSKPPSTDRKEQRERSKPGGAKPGHEGHSRVMSAAPDEVVEHRPDLCPCCLAALPGDLAAETVSVHERVELPAVKPFVTHHRRLAVGCPACGTRVVAPVPEAARGTPFGPRLHAVATYLKTFQALSYERLQGALSDLFGLTLSQGGLMNLLRRAQGCFAEGQVSAVSSLRRAEVIASDETGVRIEGSKGLSGISCGAITMIWKETSHGTPQ